MKELPAIQAKYLQWSEQEHRFGQFNTEIPLDFGWRTVTPGKVDVETSSRFIKGVLAKFGQEPYLSIEEVQALWIRYKHRYESIKI